MNVGPFLEASPVIQAHALAALVALLVGAALMLAPKGAIPHRIVGISFLALMIVVAGTAVFIRQSNNGSFSWIHLFVPLTLYAVVSGYIHAKRRDRRRHRDAMRGLFYGALIVPGLFTLLPGRLMHAVVFG